MIIKKFQGKTEEEAVSKARAELGDALVIMNVKSVKPKGMFSIFKPQMKEVTVALEDDMQPAGAQREELTDNQASDLRKAVAAVSEIAREHFTQPAESPAVSAPIPQEANTKTQAASNAVHNPGDSAQQQEGENRDTDRRETVLQNSKNIMEENVVTDLQKGGSGAGSGTDNSNIAFFKLLYSVMLENEVDEHVANQLIDELDRSMKPNMPIDFMLSNVYQKMILKFGQPSTITPAQKGPKIVFFIGPTGVGKTTTIAKIASKFRVLDKKKVALLTADTYRIAAADQLRTYANILEVPFRVIYKPAEMETAIADYKDYDYILVDTAGHSHHNEQQRENMSEFVRSLDHSIEKEIYLVVSATTKYSDLVSIANAYQTMTDYKLIFTKLDETTTLGNLLNLKIHTGAQMSYITCGQNVPDDFEVFNAQETVKRLLGGNHFT